MDKDPIQNDFAFTFSAARPVHKKGPPNIHNIPRDVAEIIVKLIQQWAEDSKGLLEERQVGRKARDCTLFSISASCRQAKDLYYEHLLRNLTVVPLTFISLYELLKNGSADGRHAISLLCAAGSTKDAQDPRQRELLESQRVEEASSFPAAKSYESGVDNPDQYLRSKLTVFQSGQENALRFIYSKLVNLQTLIIEHSPFGVPILPRSGLLPPPSFFANLKKLYFNLGRELQFSMNAQNAIWLLVQCRQLEKAALGFDMFVQDNVKFLSEHCEAYSGLSNVKELALVVRFSYDEQDPRTWWGLGEGNGFLGFNRKTQAVHDFLLVTNQLSFLEMSDGQSHREGDRTLCEAGCLLALRRSFDSLRHLRCLQVGILGKIPVFNSLTHLSLSGMTQRNFLNESEASFPALSVVTLICYSSPLREDPDSDIWSEEQDLIQLLGLIPSDHLTEVVVPRVPIDLDGEEIEGKRKVWRKRRKALEQSEIFKSGKVKLTKFGVGESFVGQEEQPISMMRWLSS